MPSRPRRLRVRGTPFPPPGRCGSSGSTPQAGPSSAEAARRLERYGANRLAEPPREPRWRAFARQLHDLLIIILLVAAVVSAVVTREWETPVVKFVLRARARR